MDERTTTPMPHNTGAASWVNILLGIWVIISPFVLSFSQLSTAMWNNVATGVAVGIIGLIRASAVQPEWSWANIILGVWLIASPFVLGFFNQVALWNNIILGIIIALVAWANAMRNAHARA